MPRPSEGEQVEDVLTHDLLSLWMQPPQKNNQETLTSCHECFLYNLPSRLGLAVSKWISVKVGQMVVDRNEYIGYSVWSKSYLTEVRRGAITSNRASHLRAIKMLQLHFHGALVLSSLVGWFSDPECEAITAKKVTAGTWRSVSESGSQVCLITVCLAFCAQVHADHCKWVLRSSIQVQHIKMLMRLVKMGSL